MRSALRQILFAAQQGYRYLLGPFRFATDQAAPLTSPYTEGGAAGSLTTQDANSVLSASGGTLLWNGTAAANTGVVSAASVARLAGRAFLISFPTRTSNSNNLRFGTYDSAAIDFNLTYGWIYSASVTDIQIRLGAAAIDSVALGSTAHVFLIVLRGTGAYWFTQTGGSGPFTLRWVDATGTNAQFIKAVATSAAAINMAADNLRVLDLGNYDSRFLTDYGIALNRSTFTASNGTALTAITPEAGGAWTDAIGTHQIQSNKLAALTQVGSESVATVASSAADVVIEVTINSSLDTNGGAVVLRFSDASNYWMITCDIGNDLFRIYDRIAGTYTLRASTTLTLSAATDYRIVVVADGSTISAYLNNGNKLTYTSTFNQTATRHGVRMVNLTSTADDFVVYPRTLSLPAGI